MHRRYATSAAEDPDQVLQVCSKMQGLCVPAGLPDCVCASGQQDNFCNASLAPDPWNDCHFCTNATAPLDNAAEAVGESAAIAAAKLVGMVVAIVLIDSKYGGRRPLLIFGSYGMGTFLFLFCCCSRAFAVCCSRSLAMTKCCVVIAFVHVFWHFLWQESP